MIFLKQFLFSLGFLLLMGCGGGGGGSAESGLATNVDAPDPIQVATTEPSVFTSSTRLADNVIANKASIRMFEKYTIRIDLNLIEHQGNFRFLKMNDRNGNILFLGQTNKEGEIQLPLHVTVNDFPLNAHIFSELASDETHIIEVNYDASFIQ